ncbi:MAG: 4Fe-4S binding protein [Ruminococcus sp.]|nr:4Fe-4S binding protein [Ruminococcus sp.]MDD5889998.1 4Fe-4S binding protein [Ruminococcus sp.]
MTDKCIKCKKCEKICPQKCINDFTINQTHCLHCGLCYEKCPVDAIKKLGN